LNYLCQRAKPFVSEAIFDGGTYRFYSNDGRFGNTYQMIPSEYISSTFSTTDLFQIAQINSIAEAKSNVNGNVRYDNIKVVDADPHGFDREGDDIGCES
jgi:hypothetical protein